MSGFSNLGALYADPSTWIDAGFHHEIRFEPFDLANVGQQPQSFDGILVSPGLDSLVGALGNSDFAPIHFDGSVASGDLLDLSAITVVPSGPGTDSLAVLLAGGSETAFSDVGSVWGADLNSLSFDTDYTLTSDFTAWNGSLPDLNGEIGILDIPAAGESTAAAGTKGLEKAPEFKVNSDGKIMVGPAGVISGLLSENQGLMFGDVHGQVDIPRYLSSQIPALKQQGVTTFFIEMVDSEDQAVLDQFAQDRDKGKLREYLVQSWDKRPGWVDAIVDLVDAAVEADIRVVGINKEDPLKSPGSQLEGRNLHWTAVVNQTMASQPSEAKYVLWGGLGHMGNYLFNKGVDALLGIPSIRFDYTGGTQLGDFGLNPGEIIYNPDPNQSDFVFQAPAMP